MPATARRMNMAVKSSITTESKSCQAGTVITVRRSIMVTGAVNGNKLNPTAKRPFGCVINTVINIKGNSYRLRGKVESEREVMDIRQ